MLNKLLKSVLDQDTAPVVVCNIDDIIVYMNPCAIKRMISDSYELTKPKKRGKKYDK